MTRPCVMYGCANLVTTMGRITCDECYEKGKLALQDKIKRERAAPMPYYPRD